MAALIYEEDWANNNAALLSALMSGNDLLASAASSVAAKQVQTPSTDITVTVYSKVYTPLGEITDWISLDCEFKRNDMGTAEIIVKGNDPIVPIIQQCVTTVVPIVIQVGDNLRWSGRVNEYAFALENKMTTCTISCVDDFTYISRMLVWPNFLMPIQIQFPKNAIFVGPAINCVLTMIAEQAFRLQTGWLDLFADFAVDDDWVQWFDQLGENVNPLDQLVTPLAVQFVSPLYDTSPWIALTGRMDKIFDLVKDTLNNYGLVLEMSLWLPGDPQPAGTIMGIPMLPLSVGELQVPTVVVNCYNRQGVTGPTGTMLDGLVEDVVDLGDSLFGQALSPFLNPSNEYYPASLGINIAPALGVNFVPSWVIFDGDNLNGGLTSYKLSGYHPLATDCIGGGKSPQWLDDLINATLEFIIDSIEILVGFTGVPDSLLDGTFDDIILAFQRMTNTTRLTQLGPYAFREYFTRTGASAATADEWFALMQAMFDTNGYVCVELKWQNGLPYSVGQDLFLGSLVSFTQGGNLYTDYLFSIKVKDDRKNRCVVECIVGNGKRNVNPIIRTLKMITGLEELINVVTMAG